MGWLKVVSVGAALGVGVAGGWIARTALPAPAPAVPAARPSERGPIALRCEGIKASELRAILVEELSARREIAGVATTPTVEMSQAPAAPVEDRLLPEDSQLLEVQDAAADGSWSPADRALLQRTLSALPPAERDAVLSELGTAVNRGELRLDVPLL